MSGIKEERIVIFRWEKGILWFKYIYKASHLDITWIKFLQRHYINGLF